MKCPICGQELRPGKKDPNYLLCYNCKKKFKAPAAKPKKEEVEAEEPKYSNNKRAFRGPFFVAKLKELSRYF